MILQALVRCYEALAERGELEKEGWSPVKVSWGLELDADGQVKSLLLMGGTDAKGKQIPRVMKLPDPVKRSSGVAANFLCDNSAYVLGVDAKGKPERTRECFAACARKHQDVLKDVRHPTAKAILNFFERWKPENAACHPAIQPNLETLLKGGNIVFVTHDAEGELQLAQDVPEIRRAWDEAYAKSDDAVMGRCLVTGEEGPIAILHPSIKGVMGAQSSGASLVSFNAPAFESYGKESARDNQGQGRNAPVGKYAAFAYTSALNHLLADKDNVQHIGDTTVVCWAEGAEPQYDAFAMGALFGGEAPAGYTEEDVRAIVKRLAEGKPCEELDLHPDRTFYILGLAPNAARLSVRFFLRDTFGRIMKNINEHNERMEIIRPANDNYVTLPMWAMLRETVNLNSRDKTPNPAMSGATARAIFTGGMYPVSLLENTMLRIRAERNITRGRAAIIKAYYLKNTNMECPKEVLTVALNEESRNIPYTLGRLFSVYEAAQQAANPGINTTIKDRYFNSAAATPAMIFPILGNLYQKHLRKLEGGSAVYFDKQVMELKGILKDEYPMRLTLPQQGSFDLGYYHQTQKRYTKKEDK